MVFERKVNCQANNFVRASQAFFIKSSIIKIFIIFTAFFLGLQFVMKMNVFFVLFDEGIHVRDMVIRKQHESDLLAATASKNGGCKEKQQRRRRRRKSKERRGRRLRITASLEQQVRAYGLDSLGRKNQGPHHLLLDPR